MEQARQAKVPGAIRGGLTKRAVVLGLLGSLAIAFAAPHAALVLMGSNLDYDFSTPGALLLLFFLATVVNGLLRRFAPAKALSSAELGVAYALMVVANAIPVMGFGGQLLPIITAPVYYATLENKWDQVLAPLIRPQLTPHDETAVRLFFEGAGPGAKIPWLAWAQPLAWWLVLTLVLYFTMACLASLLHRQWSSRERLAYPVAQLPLELANNAPGLMRNKMLWLGFAIPFTVGMLSGFHYFYPAVPAPTMVKGFMTFKNSVLVIFRLSFPMLGFFYLVNKDALFSLWAFNRLYWLARGILVLLALDFSEATSVYGVAFAPFKHIGEGAMVALVVTNFWTARGHLASAWQCALGKGGKDYDADEVASYRVLFAGAGLGFALLVAWIVWTGLGVLPAVLVVTFMMAIFLGLTRVVVEGGFAEAVAPTTASDMTVAVLGSPRLGPQGLMALALTYPYAADLRTHVMASTSHGLKVVEDSGGRLRGLLLWIMVAAAVTLVAAIFYVMRLAYTIGGAGLHGWFFIDGPQMPYKWVTNLIDHPVPIKTSTIGLMAGGAAFLAFLSFMRVRFLWWPLHPLGFAIGSVWLMDQQWLCAFIAWVLKVLILRYGGLRYYRLMRPAFLGLILGQFTVNIIWIAVDTFTGSRGHEVFFI